MNERGILSKNCSNHHLDNSIGSKYGGTSLASIIHDSIMKKQGSDDKDREKSKKRVKNPSKRRSEPRLSEVGSPIYIDN